MISAEVLQGIAVLVVALIAGTLELGAAHPRHLGAIFRLTPAWKYLGLNLFAAAVAYALVTVLDVTFREPNGLWTVLACGVTSMTVLRSGVIQSEGVIKGPAAWLQTLRDEFEREFKAKVNVEGTDDIDAAIAGLTWDKHREALVSACLIIMKGSANDKEIKRASDWVKAAASLGGTDEIRLLALAASLEEAYGLDVLRAAAKRARGETV